MRSAAVGIVVIAIGGSSRASIADRNCRTSKARLIRRSHRRRNPGQTFGLMICRFAGNGPSCLCGRNHCPSFSQPRRTVARSNRGLGVQVDLMSPQPGLPDLVFTANAGLMFGRTFYSARFRYSERARESPVFDAWFAEHGFEVRHLPEGMYHEGAGDALFCGDMLFAGYRIRSAVHGHPWLGQTLD